ATGRCVCTFATYDSAVRTGWVCARGHFMKLALLIYKYFPFGGQQRDFMQILQRCQQAGHQIVVYCLKWQGPQPDDIEVVRVPVKALSSHVRYQRYTAWVQAEL